MENEKRIIAATVAVAFSTALLWSVALWLYMEFFVESTGDRSFAVGYGLMFAVPVGLFVGVVAGLMVGLANQTVTKSFVLGFVVCFACGVLFSIRDATQHPQALVQITEKLKFLLVPSLLTALVSALAAALFNKPEND